MDNIFISIMCALMILAFICMVFFVGVKQGATWAEKEYYLINRNEWHHYFFTNSTIHRKGNPVKIKGYADGKEIELDCIEVWYRQDSDNIKLYIDGIKQ